MCGGSICSECQGITLFTGNDGVGIESIVTNPNGSLTITYTDGNTYTSSSLTGPQGATGATGPAGQSGDLLTQYSFFNANDTVLASGTAGATNVLLLSVPISPLTNNGDRLRVKALLQQVALANCAVNFYLGPSKLFADAVSPTLANSRLPFPNTDIMLAIEFELVRESNTAVYLVSTKTCNSNVNGQQPVMWQPPTTPPLVNVSTASTLEIRLRFFETGEISLLGLTVDKILV